ncbi:hypothetical protein [Thiofilum flexile]|uniref:hypothetical protein n=1 Tax=Thiofilum flexile TaxID=125627 RepID=UPI000367AAEA|nr:hypothetical protein [Thiofilum flexile]
MKAMARHLGYWLLLVLLLGGCMGEDSKDPQAIANQFWNAVTTNDMETAKNLTTWDSVQYLSFLKTAQLNPQRYELGELKMLENNTKAEIPTVLHGGELGNVNIPVRTILVKVNEEWRIDVQSTLGALIQGTMGAVVNELNGLLQQGLKGLDEKMNKTLDGLGEQLNKSLDKLQKDLQISPPVNEEPAAKDQII